jgi:hypothetical protein
MQEAEIVLMGGEILQDLDHDIEGQVAECHALERTVRFDHKLKKFADTFAGYKCRPAQFRSTIKVSSVGIAIILRSLRQQISNVRS